MSDTDRPQRPDRKSSIRWAGETQAGALLELHARAEGASRPTPLAICDTPWDDAAKLVSMFSGVHVLVSERYEDRTALAMALAAGAALAGSPIAYLGGTMARGELAERYYTNWPEKCFRLKEAPFIAHEMECTPEALANLSERLQAICEVVDTRKHRPLIVVDFIQIMQQPMGMREQWTHRARIEHGMCVASQVARQNKCPVLVLSSTSRTNAKRLAQLDVASTDPQALVNTPEHSGFIENLAHSVWVMRCDGSRVDVAIAKNRAGSTGWLRLWKDGWRFGL